MANEPITREEMLLNAVATGEAAKLEPITREEMFLAKLGGVDVKTPTPITRKEQFLQKAIENAGSGGSGGGDGGGNTTIVTGTVTPTEDTAQIPITHNLGAVPHIAICYMEAQTECIRDEVVVSGKQAFAYSINGTLVGALYKTGSGITSSLSTGSMCTTSGVVDHKTSDNLGNFSVLLSATETTATLCTLANTPNVTFSAGKTYRWILISEDGA